MVSHQGRAGHQGGQGSWVACVRSGPCQIGAGTHGHEAQGQAKRLPLRITTIAIVVGGGAGAATHKVQSCVTVDLTSPTSPILARLWKDDSSSLGEDRHRKCAARRWQTDIVLTARRRRASGRRTVLRLPGTSAENDCTVSFTGMQLPRDRAADTRRDRSRHVRHRRCASRGTVVAGRRIHCRRPFSRRWKPRKETSAKNIG